MLLAGTTTAAFCLGLVFFLGLVSFSFLGNLDSGTREVDLALEDGRPGIADPCIADLPGDGWPFLREGFFQAGFAGTVIAGGTAPLRPVLSHERERQGNGAQDKGQTLTHG